MTTVITSDLVHQGLPSRTFSRTVRFLLGQRFEAYSLDRRVPPGMVDDIYLATSELINNACIATPNDPITFKARLDARSVWVGVWDSSNVVPRPKPIVELDLDDITPDIDALDEGYRSDQIGGWGLPLVMALTRDRNIAPTPPRGKWVGARFSF